MNTEHILNDDIKWFSKEFFKKAIYFIICWLVMYTTGLIIQKTSNAGLLGMTAGLSLWFVRYFRNTHRQLSSNKENIIEK